MAATVFISSSPPSRCKATTHSPTDWWEPTTQLSKTFLIVQGKHATKGWAIRAGCVGCVCVGGEPINVFVSQQRLTYSITLSCDTFHRISEEMLL